MQLYQLKFPNGKSYIGITSRNINVRFDEHCRAKSKNLCQKAIHKYGKENISIAILAVTDNWELLCLAEMEAIEKFNTFKPNGYNLTLGGEGVLTVGIHGEERVARDKSKLSAYKKANRIKINLVKNKYRSNNRDKDAEYRLKNKEKLAKKRKEYDIKNREILAKKRKIYKEKVKNNPLRPEK